MKSIKKTTCLALVMLMVLMGTTALAGTKYSNAVIMGTVLVKPEATPELTPDPTEEPLPSEEPETTPDAEENAESIFQRDAEGNLILDENGEPLMTLPEGAAIPTGFQRDENSALILDENGNPIPVYEAVEEEPTEEPAVEPEYLTDAEGNPVLDLNGDPIPAGEYMLDENGALIFDENGKPIPVTEEAPVEETDPLEGLRQIIVLLREGETVLPLHAEASSESEIIAEIPVGEILYVKNIEAEWSYAVYGENEGFVHTSKIALYNEETTPEEEEIIRSVILTSNAAGKEAVYAGDEIVLYAILTGFENDQYTIQWQYSTDGGMTFIDIEGANDLQYAFIIDDSNAWNVWKINITIVEPVAEETVETPAEEVSETPAA